MPEPRITIKCITLFSLNLIISKMAYIFEEPARSQAFMVTKNNAN